MQLNCTQRQRYRKESRDAASPSSVSLLNLLQPVAAEGWESQCAVVDSVMEFVPAQLYYFNASKCYLRSFQIQKVPDCTLDLYLSKTVLIAICMLLFLLFFVFNFFPFTKEISFLFQ